MQIRFIDIGGYRHNYKDFCKNLIYPMSIKNRKMTTIHGAHECFLEILSFILFFS